MSDKLTEAGAILDWAVSACEDSEPGADLLATPEFTTSDRRTAEFLAQSVRLRAAFEHE